MIGSLSRRGVGSWDAPFSHVGEKKETNAQDVAIQAVKETTKAENVRLQNVRQAAVAQINATAATASARWTPIIVVVGAVVVGGIALAVAARRKRR